MTARKINLLAADLRRLAISRFGDVGSDLRFPRKSLLPKVTIKKTSIEEAFLMVPLARIGLATPPLPRVCSTTEL